MRVAHHTTNPLDLERAAHMLFHCIEDRLEASREVGFDLVNVRTVTNKTLSHCWPSSLRFDGEGYASTARASDFGIDRYIQARSPRTARLGPLCVRGRR